MRERPAGPRCGLHKTDPLARTLSLPPTVGRGVGKAPSLGKAWGDWETNAAEAVGPSSGPPLKDPSTSHHISRHETGKRSTHAGGQRTARGVRDRRRMAATQRGAGRSPQSPTAVRRDAQTASLNDRCKHKLSVIGLFLAVVLRTGWVDFIDHFSQVLRFPHKTQIILNTIDSYLYCLTTTLFAHYPWPSMITSLLILGGSFLLTIGATWWALRR